jgi:glycosyltransferase involved in cell wall biosynthesis
MLEHKLKEWKGLKKPIKIALFSGYFNDKRQYGGGIGAVVANLAYRLSGIGHEVYVFTAHGQREKIRHDLNLHIIQYPSLMKIRQEFISLDLLVKPLKYNVDVVHIQGGIIASISGLLYSIIRKKPLVVTVHHTGDVWKDPIKNFIVFLYECFILRMILEKACKIIIPSIYLLSQSKHLTRFKNKVIGIPNGVDINSVTLAISKEEARKKLRLPPDIKIVLFVGALCKRKGVEVLIRAAEIIAKKFPKCLFILIGYETEETKYLKQLIKAKNLDKYVKLVGYVSDALKKMYYRAADMFVLPSLSEGFGLVLLEAGVNGLPLIVSDLPVFKILIRDGYNGLFSKRGDAEDLANKILYLLENESISIEIGENSRKLAISYSWERVAEETLKVYKWCLLK